jgi:hypothetical protein
MRKDPKVMITGLDATCTLVRLGTGEGGMPSLAKLVSAGASGKVESILQPARPGRTAQAATTDEEFAKVEVSKP